MLLRIKIPRKLSQPYQQSAAVNIELACHECRGTISAEEKFCTHCHAVILRRYCPGCSKLVPDHILICPFCSTSAGEKPKGRLLSNPTHAVTAILVLGFLALLFLWPDQPDQNDQKVSEVQTANHTKVVVQKPVVSNQPLIQKVESTKMNSEPQKLTSNVPAQNAPTQKVQEVAQLNQKGHSLMKQGRYHEAVPLLSKAVNKLPQGTQIIDHVFAQYNLGHSLRKIGKSEDAIPLLERCVAYDRQNVMFQRELQAARRDLSRKEHY